METTGLPPRTLCVIAEDIPSHSNEVRCLPVIMLLLEDHLLHFRYGKVCYHLLHQTNPFLCLMRCNSWMWTRGGLSRKVRDILFCCTTNERYSFTSNFRRQTHFNAFASFQFIWQQIANNNKSEIYFLLTQPEAHCKIFVSGE